MFVLTMLACLAAETNRQPVVIQAVLSTNTAIVKTVSEDDLFVSLAGVGTPETSDERRHPHLLSQADPNWTAALLPSGTKVLMEQRGTTWKGRPQVVLYRESDNLCWNEWLVRKGGAFATDLELVNYVSHEEQARKERIGLWKTLPLPPPPEEKKPVLASEMYSSGIQNFDPSHFSRPGKPRYIRTDFGQTDFFGMPVASYGGGGYSSYSSGYGGGGYGDDVHVSGYYRRDGTYVGSHMRSSPDGNPWNNYSTYGNRNPYTGRIGSRRP